MTITRDEMIKMAREAGFNVEENGAINDGIETAADFSNELARFAALVAAAEREACASICDRFQARDVGMQPAECAAAIRARSAQ